MYTLNITKAIKKMSVNEIRVIIFKNYYKRIGFSEENNYYSMKNLKKKERFIIACKQINIEKYLILVMVKNTINHL